MSATILTAATDMALDASNFGYNVQGQAPEDKESFMRALLPGMAVWGGWLGSSALLEGTNVQMLGGRRGTKPFARGSLLERMSRVNTPKARGALAKEYFRTGKYNRDFSKYASTLGDKAEELTKIKSAESFASTAERAYFRGAAGQALRHFAGAANMALFIAPGLFGMTYHGIRGIKKLGYELETPAMGGHFITNGAQATERQRVMGALHNSEFNGRSAIGSEAQLYHI
jgi:hypothetical protein